MQVEANGGLVGYRTAGSGPAVVLLHGGEADSGMFRWLMPHLARSFTVVAPDQRDSGETRFPDVPYSHADHAADVVGMMRALGLQRAHVLGTSYGSTIAQEVALRYPESVERLVLSVPRAPTLPSGDTAIDGGSPYEAALRASLQPRALAVILAMQSGDPAALLEFRSLLFAPGATDRFPELLDRAAEIVVERTAEQAQRRMGSLREFAAGDRLPGLRAPTLVLAAGGDQVMPPDAALRVAQLIPDSTYVSMPRMGHLWPIEAPERVAPILELFFAGAI